MTKIAQLVSGIIEIQTQVSDFKFSALLTRMFLQSEKPSRAGAMSCSPLFHLEPILVSGKLFEQMNTCMCLLFLHSQIHLITTVP